MTKVKALDVIRALAAAQAVEITEHALKEAKDEGFMAADVVNALENAQSCEREPGKLPKWKVYGPSFDDENMAVITLIVGEKSLRVITVHLPP